MIVYIAVNRVNGKAYVGQTAYGFNHRRSGHKNTLKQVFHNAIRKYGFENFDWAVLEHCETREDANQRERYWISTLGSVSPNGYNVAHGGRGSSGVPMKPHVRERLAAMRRGKPSWNAGMTMPPEWMTTEHAKAISDALKAKYSSTPHHMIGRKDPDDVRARKSAALKGKNAGHKNGMYRKSVRLGSKHTEESNRKNSEAHRRIWSDPEYRKRIKTNKGKPWSAARRAAYEARQR